ncbi:MAG TPA: CCA tRNA nucleotidyltransferase [Xanthobacteraceae bacterium]
MTAPVQLADAAWLTQDEAAGLLALLNQGGEEARVVGGAVRNELLHLPVAEIDVATTAEPNEVIRRVEAAGWKAVPTGVEHGTITVVINSRPFEVTTLRQDVETFGRKARVKFGRDWRADAERRDFTINALSVSADGEVFDYVGGRDDIAARRVRFIGEPQQRIAEDYLRILRFFRFHAYFAEGEPDAAGLHACIVARAGLDTLSRERVRMELLKLFIAPRGAPTLTVMAESGLLGPVLGGVPYVASFAKLAAIETALGSAPDPVRRLGALGVMVREDAERLAQRLRLFNVESERLSALDGWWLIEPSLSEQAAHALLYRLGPQCFADRVLHAWAHANTGATDEAWRELLSLPHRWTAPQFQLKSADFIHRGVPAGPALGAAMRAAKDAWIAADFPQDRATVEAIVERAAVTATSGG